MDYEHCRNFAKTGDIIGCEGKSFVQVAIRKITGQSFNHVAMLVWIDTGLYIFEFVEGDGFRFVPASAWVKKRLKKKEFLYWGKAPKIIRDGELFILDHVTTIRKAEKSKRNYNYWELPVIWASQYLGFNVEALSGVCSTSIAQAWKKCGYRWQRMPRPGDFMHHCEELTLINKIK